MNFLPSHKPCGNSPTIICLERPDIGVMTQAWELGHHIHEYQAHVEANHHVMFTEWVLYLLM